ncbi:MULTISPECIES: T9SS sorting signal type C domain-containing protein [Flavobacterium]|uniref:T9SS sorting signal type C domain-containing protein n=1 Tax=Flavobacterium TaxID=237 RepID=UPI001183236F|nr:MULTISPECIES: T9SS sorting signal type C domain-containing protein [Flavobacterium]MCR4033186.1 T9SS sorting signal type C domain-containing protein [Flavobacterium panacis]
MKKKLPASLILPQFFIFRFSLTNLHSKVSCSKVKLSAFFFLFSVSLWAQHPPFNADGTIFVPAGVLTMNVEGWGAGGAGGGASGSVALTGRSGAGGGGGAHAQAVISVTAGTTLQIKVAPAVAGTTGTGGNGGNSYIQGFESFFLAAGGSGGAANTTGTAAGGLGGSASISKGSVPPIAGSDGGAGAAALLNLLASSGVGGKAGGTGGGAGGVAAGSVLLGAGPGQPGTPPGGGGSGGLHLSGSPAQPGGAGAAGRVNVTYTCPTYGVNSTSALTGACTSLGTATIQLTATAALLPIGVYTVTYNRSIPTGSNLTTTMTILAGSAGTGTFVAEGLTTAGTSVITVTNIRSGVCSTNISSFNTANVTVSSPSVGGNVTGGTTICSGATSGTLTLSGQTGAVTKWQSSVSPFSTWTDITGTTNLTTYVSGALTQTTQFKAIVQNGACSVVESSPTTVTVNPLPQGSLSAVSPLCGSGAGQLTFTASAGTGPYTIVYTENNGTNRTATGVVSGTAFTPFTTPVTANTAYNLVSVTDSNSCIRSTGFTGASATITVNPLPQGSLSAVSPLCGSGAGQLTFTATAGTGPYTIVYTENNGANRTATGVVSGTAFTPFTTPVTANTAYNLVSVTGANSCVRTSGFTGASATITVNPLPQGSLSAVSPLCGSGAGQLTFTATAGTGPYTIVYTENNGANRTATGVVSGTAFTPFTTPVTANTAYNLVSVTDSNSCIRSTGFTGVSATITVNPLPQGSLSAVSPLCGSGAGQLTFTATAGTGPYTIVYTENNGTNRTATGVVSGAAFTPFTTPVTANTAYNLVSVTGANSCVRTSGFTGASATIVVNPLPQGSLSAVSPLCGSGAGQLTFTATAGTGPFTVVYTENNGTNRTATGVVSGTAFTPFTTPVTANTAYNLVSVTDSNSCIRSTGFTGVSATITVNPLPQGSLSAVSPLCGSGAGQLTFTATAGTGPYTIVYTENNGTNRTATGVVSGAAFTPFTTPVTANTAYNLVSVTGANSCVRTSGFTGASATIVVNPLPQGSLSAVSPLCGSGAGQLIFTATAGTGPYTIVYTENNGANRTATGVVSGTAFTPFTTPVTANTAYNLVSVTDSNSCIRSTGFTGGSATITVNPLPQGSLSAVSPLCGSGAGQLTFTATAGTGPYTIVYTENNGTNRTATGVVSGTAFTPFTTPVTVSTTYTLVSVTGANSCARTTGFTGGSATITVTPLPSTPVIGTVTQPTCVTPTGSIVLNSLLSTPSWIITEYGTVSQTYTSSGTTYTISNLSPGNYNFTIQEPSGCPSMPTANVEILAPVTNTWNGTAWSKGSEPTLTDAIRFSGNYSTTGDLSGCSCTVDSGVNVTVNSNHTLTITNAVTNTGGTLTFENNSSLVQTANVINTGNIIYKRDTKPVRRYDFTHWSTPVKRTPAFTLHDLSPNTLADKYFKFDPVALWVLIYGGTDEMEPGRGYTVRAPQSNDLDVPSVYNSQFIGVPNNGDILGPPPVADKYNLVGNPYPSALYADRFINDNQANIYGTIYIWTHNTLPKPYTPGNGFYYYSNDDYAIYNLSGSVAIGIPSPNPGNQSTPSGYIASGQGFLVRARTNQRVIFTNAMRVPGENSQFFRTSSTAAVEKHRAWLNLSNTVGAFKQLLIGYITGATNSWDNNFDAVSLDAHPDIDFYSVNNNRKLVIQGRALPFTVSDTIPLGYRSALKGEFTIAIDHTDGNLSDQTIYLQDNVTKKVHNLNTGGYTFTTEIGVFQKRFVLRYTDPNGTLGNDDFTNSERNIAVSVKDKNIKLQSFSDSENLEGVSVYDVGGKLLYDKKGIDNKEWLITNLRSGPQVLLLRITLDNGKTVARKVIYN